MSLEPSPRGGLNVDLVWTQLPHSLDTQSTPHPQTLALHADWTPTSTVTGYSAKEGPEGKEVVVYIRGAKTFSVTVKVSGIRIVVRIIYSSFYRIT